MEDLAQKTIELFGVSVYAAVSWVVDWSISGSFLLLRRLVFFFRCRMLMIRQKISEMEMTTTSTTKIVSTGRSPMLMSHNCSCPPILSSKQTKSQQFVSILNKRQPGGGVQRTSRHSYNKIIFNSIRKVFKSHFLTFALPFSHKQSLHKSRPGGTK